MFCWQTEHLVSDFVANCIVLPFGSVVTVDPDEEYTLALEGVASLARL